MQQVDLDRKLVKKEEPTEDDRVIIPHFHGLNFDVSEFSEQEQYDFFQTFRFGNVPYYSESILRNAYIRCTKKIISISTKIFG